MQKAVKRSVRSLLIVAVIASTTFPAHASTTGSASTSHDRVPTETPVYAIVHVDIEPNELPRALPLLKSYAQQAAKDPNVLHIDVLQQKDAGNHFTLVEVMRSDGAYRQVVQQPYAKAMRAELQPMLGSPFDERLHSSVQLR